jgi:hypothetical protein
MGSSFSRVCDTMIYRYCSLVDISYGMCEYNHQLGPWITYTPCVVICIVAVKYAQNIYQSCYCGHMLICDGLCCLFKA